MIEYGEIQIVRCSPDSMFSVIADIESYPEFLPGWDTARIRSRENGLLTVDQNIGIGPVCWKFTSYATLRKKEEVIIRSQDGPFQSLEVVWKLAGAGEGFCAVEFRLHAELSSVLFEKYTKKLFSLSSHNIVSTFTQRACACDKESSVLGSVNGL